MVGLVFAPRRTHVFQLWPGCPFPVVLWCGPCVVVCCMSCAVSGVVLLIAVRKSMYLSGCVASCVLSGVVPRCVRLSVVYCGQWNRMCSIVSWEAQPCGQVPSVGGRLRYLAMSEREIDDLPVMS